MKVRRPLPLKARALQWLAGREYSRVELRSKLLAYAAPHADDAPASGASEHLPDTVARSRHEPPGPELQARVDALLDELAANRQLSEARFIEARLRVRAARHGNLRIRQELAQHGLQLAPADEQALKDSEIARARQVLQRKFDAAPSGNAERARQARFLAGRGFSAEVIHRLLRGHDE